MLKFQFKYVAKSNAYEIVLRQETIKKMKDFFANVVINDIMTMKKIVFEKKLINSIKSKKQLSKKNRIRRKFNRENKQEKV